MFTTPTSSQMSLPGTAGGDEPAFEPEHLPGAGHTNRYLLFFALLPPPAIAQQASALAQELRRTRRLPQQPMAAERLHLTLQPVVAFAQAVPRLIVRAATAAASGVAGACRSVPLRFDRVGSMGIRAPSVLALRCDTASCQAVAALRDPLAQALRRHGFLVTVSRVPHMSLIYGTELVAERAVAPIAWTATRLVLILSHQGRGHHQLVQDWPLPGA